MNSPETKKIKLLILIPSLECGGSERFVSLLCNHIDTGKFSVVLTVLNNAEPFYEINEDIKVVDLQVKRVSRSFFKIKSILKQQQPDIIFTTANHLNLYIAIFRGFLSGKVPLIARESSIVSINNRRAKFPFIYERLVKKFYLRFDNIICQSVYMQDDLVRNYNIPENKIIVINNPVEEINKFDEPVTVGQEGSGTYIFITVARLSEEKGIDRLIKALSLLTLPYKYYIIGEGDKRKELQHLINTLGLEKSIYLCGQKKDPYAGFEPVDLMLMGSLYEGFPNVLTEAGARGIPVIAFDAPGGIREIIFNGENGLLVPDNDVASFSDTIEKGVQMKFDRNKIIESTLKRFPINAAMIRLEEIFIRRSNSFMQALNKNV